MAYYTKVLRPDEVVTYVGKLHWTIYRLAILFGILTIIVAAVGLDQDPDYRPVAAVATAVMALLTIISFLRSWFIRVTTEIVVTDKRVIHKVGWISRHTEEINVSKVETVDVTQGILERLLGSGTVLIRGIGGSWEPLRRVASPLELRNAIIVG
jgi:uncharacterized membrane protein YdbT with pleckstrin-like domain